MLPARAPAHAHARDWIAYVLFPLAVVLGAPLALWRRAGDEPGNAIRHESGDDEEPGRPGGGEDEPDLLMAA